MIVFFPKNLKELSLFYLANDFIGGTILLNDRSVQWENDQNINGKLTIISRMNKTFFTIEKKNERNRSFTNDERTKREKVEV